MGLLTWSGPALMLFARSIFSVLAQGLVAGVYAFQSSTTPWVAAAAWLPVYATLIDAGCLGLLWALTRREGIALLDLVSFERGRWRRDVVLGLGLIPVNLLFIFGGISIAASLSSAPRSRRPPFGRFHCCRHCMGCSFSRWSGV